MRSKIILFLMIVMGNVYGQNTIKMTNNNRSQNKELNQLIDFENIFIENLQFEGSSMLDKGFVLNLEEYKDGKLVQTTLLFDGSQSDDTKIKLEQESLMLMFKMSENTLKTQVRGRKFGSKKKYFPLQDDADTYALKDFFGRKKELQLEVDKKNTILAIITPTIHADGSGSYCEVVQNDIIPEKLGEHFKIPHHFLVTLTFK